MDNVLVDFPSGISQLEESVKEKFPDWGAVVQNKVFNYYTVSDIKKLAMAHNEEKSLI